jgi:hypothetical protein
LSEGVIVATVDVVEIDAVFAEAPTVPTITDFCFGTNDTLAGDTRDGPDFSS